MSRRPHPPAAARWRPALPYLAAGALTAALAVPLLIGVAFPRQFPPGPVALAVVCGCVGGRWSRRDRLARGAFVGVAAAGLPAVLLAGHDVGQWVTLLATLGFAVVLPWLLGRGWRRLVDQGRSAAAQAARLRERARIAEDMHDALGHELSLIALRAGALELSLGGAQQDAVAALRESAACATERLRDIVGVLRDDTTEAPRAPAGDVHQLVARARAAGATLTYRDTAGDLPDDLAATAHRIVQEGLTNAAKHAPRAPVEVHLARHAGVLRVSVTNGSGRPGTPYAPASGGVGLVALDERVRLAGGTLAAGPGPDGGWRLSAELPVRPGGFPGFPGR